MPSEEDHVPKLVIDDCYEAEITNPEVRTVDDACRRFFTATPGWLVNLMRFRNKIVGPLGFTAGEDEPPVMPERLAVGDKLSVFTVIERTDDEVIFGIDDRHFSMRLVVGVEESRKVALTTTAHANDLLGRLYLSTVKYPHRPISAQMVKVIAR